MNKLSFLFVAIVALIVMPHLHATPLITDDASALSSEEKQRISDFDQDLWQAELLIEQIDPLLDQLFDHFLNKQGLNDTVRALFSEDFQGTPLSQAETLKIIEETVLKVETFAIKPTFVSLNDFWHQIQDYFQKTLTITETEFHIDFADVSKGGEETLFKTRLDIHFMGHERREPKMIEGYWEIDFTKDQQDSWKIDRIHPQRHQVIHGKSVFTDITASLPSSSLEIDPTTIEDISTAHVGNGISLADWDNDGDLDLFLARPKLTPLFYENDGLGAFKDISRKMRKLLMFAPKESTAGYFFDADNDGDLDFLHLKPRRILFFENRNLKFIEITRQSGLDRLPRGLWFSAAFADYDLDGKLDIYLTRYRRFQNRPLNYFDRIGRPNVLLKNKGQLQFIDVTEETGLNANNQRFSYAAAWGDYNRDGYPDLYVANDFGVNTLYTNLKTGKFQELALALGADDPGNGMGVSWLDYDNDGYQDLYISNMLSYAGSRITHSANFQGDPSLVKLAQKFAKGNTLLKNEEGRTFQEMSSQMAVEKAGWAWGIAAFDYDLDGDEDIYVANGYFSTSNSGDT